ncbi:hypothetical protein HYH03_015408 [Edaphochlamys debaryana]|uniref:Serine/threonine-protein phosphatase n=1 Tax=Edaphochlamys debaryana TaxID=47281 RepID=A0A835XRW2_9CHLO|nr:hypothetical protein HYH03_015408 [Edaphochlamys debaryana]|eukprot:KAG2485825.1 hypothetical protein HYH03_015408 [Edaphochlamys debaryana]
MQFQAPSMERALALQKEMLAAIPSGAAALKAVLSADQLVAMLKAAEALLAAEPTLVELNFPETDVQPEVLVFGDTHGHYVDVSAMLDALGPPGPSRVYVFNGDYVDRGSWAVELLALLVALKLAAPKHVVLLRGNHESSTCTKYYGYSQEVRAKYDKQSKFVYAASKKLFSVMPLAALVQNSTIIMHGGLFRRPPEPKRGAKRRKSAHPGRGGAGGCKGLVPGSLDDLRRATKGGMDPDGCGSSLLATDVLWSDPVAAPGIQENEARGVGLIFGPDVTEAFLRANNLKLVIRSHEGPDARDKRSDLGQVLQGYSVDHTTPAGQLMTVFSAPDYPQFQVLEDDEDGTPGQRYNNLAAVAVLRGPGYASPDMRTFEAVQPRPKADPYYDFAACCDSDIEAPAGSEGGSEGASGLSQASDADPDGDEAVGLEAAPAAAHAAEAGPGPGGERPAMAVTPPQAPTPPGEAGAGVEAGGAACSGSGAADAGGGAGDAAGAAPGCGAGAGQVEAEAGASGAAVGSGPAAGVKEAPLADAPGSEAAGCCPGAAEQPQSSPAEAAPPDADAVMADVGVEGLQGAGMSVEVVGPAQQVEPVPCA